MNYNNDLPGGKQATKGDKKKNDNRYILYGLFPFVQNNLHLLVSVGCFCRVVYEIPQNEVNKR
jgi:hypothetical protein